MSLKSSSLVLENAFFVEQDQILMKKLRELKVLQESKEALKIASGIKDDDLLEKLVNLKITPQSLAALMVIPLIETAWADGTISPNEKEKILDCLHNHGVKKSSMEYDLVELWLSHKPDEKLLVAWEQMVKEICASMSNEDRDKFHLTLMNDTKAVAKSAGGFLGLGKVSKEEKAMLDRLNSAFN